MNANHICRTGSRAHLRDATAEAHRALHHLPAFEALLEGSLDRSGYARLLRGLHAYHAVAQPVCAAADARLGIDPAGAWSGARVDRLAADLDGLGLAATPPPARAPHVDPAWNVGFAYVVAGSAIGGQILYRALETLLPGDSPGRSFFDLAPDERSAWRRFCALIDNAIGAEHLPQAERGAHAAFALFRATIDYENVIIA